MSPGIDRPVFVIGTGRSGTTLVFELIAAHRDVAWFSQYANRLPGVPAVALLNRLADWSQGFRKSVNRSDRRRAWTEKLRVGPVEAYDVFERCCGERFRYDFLLGEEATPEAARCLRAVVAGCLRYQSKPRFATKITGPGRVHYLNSVFPDARFLHVVRDGRAVVQSLLQVPFWRDSFRMHEPAWANGLTEAELERWRERDRSPLALAAIQWRACIERTREEAQQLEAGRYAEFRYEDFLQSPRSVLEDMLRFCELAPSRRVEDFLKRRFELRDMNFQWRERFSDAEQRTLNELMGPCLASLGYRDPTRGGAQRAAEVPPLGAPEEA